MAPLDVYIPLLAAALGLAMHTAAQPAAVIKLGFMGPFDATSESDPSATSRCPACGAAFLSAVHYANTHRAEVYGTTAAFNFTIAGALEDSSSKIRGVSGADYLLANRSCTGAASCGAVNPVGADSMVMVADLFSSTVRFTGLLAEMHRKPMLGYGSTSDDFTDKAAYPFFSRVVSPDRFQAQALADVIVDFGWERVALVFVDGAYGANFAVQFDRTAEAAGVVVHKRVSLKASSTASTMEPQLRQVMQSGAKVIVLAASSADVLTVLRAANTVGALGSEYTWIGPDGVTSSTVLSQSGPDPDTARAAAGLLGLFPRFDPDSATAAVVRDDVFQRQTWRASGVSHASFVHVNNATIEPWAYYVWDAVIFAARACGLAHGPCLERGGATHNSTCVQAFLRNGSLAGGATGDIELDSVGDRRGSYTLLNLQPDNPLTFVPVGTIAMANGSSTVTVQRRSILWPDGSTGTETVPTDGNFDPLVRTDSTSVLPIVGAMIAAFVVLFAGTYVFYRRKYRRKLLRARANLAKLGKFREGSSDWAAHIVVDDAAAAVATAPGAPPPPSPPGGSAGGPPARASSEDGAIDGGGSTPATADDTTIVINPVGPGRQSSVPGPSTLILPTASGPPSRSGSDSSRGRQWAVPVLGDPRWYWSEPNARRRRRHASSGLDVVDDAWVSFAPEIKLEAAYQVWRDASAEGGRDGAAAGGVGCTVEFMAGQIPYEVNFHGMTQRNLKTGYTRLVLRRVRPIRGGVEVPGTQSQSAATTSDAESVGLPRGLVLAGDQVLPVCIGHLIEVTNSERRDGWLYGTAVFFDADVGNATNPTRAESIVGRSGWFQEGATVAATTELQLKFQDSLGQYEASELDPPSTWEDVESMNDTVRLFPVALDAPEVADMVATFNSTMNGQPAPRCTPIHATIERIDRIQNLPMWRSYAVKAIQTKNRGEKSNLGYPLVRGVAWHGTTRDISDKIMQQGFNRSFCGRNMCRYGKGVYFARDAAYSAQPEYAQAEEDGLCRMFSCRVVHGVYCEGTDNALVPDILDPETNRLYDSTTNDVHNPIMWVTYHDAQAYPEYLLHFRKFQPPAKLPEEALPISPKKAKRLFSRSVIVANAAL
eukprot:m.60706 g.60706  ORF g.60706 m.60706 type:complete len:1108 (-) comp17479_c0_seq3:48-3371(-)